MKDLEKLYFTYIEDLYSGVSSTNKMKNKRWIKASELDSDYALASTPEKEKILKQFQVNMNEFKNQGRNVDKYILN